MITRRIEIVNLLPPGAKMAEIGVAEGLFSADLLACGVGKLIMVDNWGHIPGVTGDGNFPQHWHDKNYSDAVKRVEVFGDRAIIRRGMSTDVARTVPESYLDAVYFDAGHYYDAVKADLSAWYPKVRPGGVVAGHDYLNADYQVREAVEDFIISNNLDVKVFVIPENKKEDASFYFIKP